MEAAASVAGAFAALCAVAYLAFMGGKSNTDRGVVDESRASEPLIAKKGSQHGTAPGSVRIDVPSAASGSSASMAPTPTPRFINRTGAGEATPSSSSSGPAGAKGVSVLFCRCGGPNTLVKLLPCGHASLCLACAQLEATCPTCGAAIADSYPSFKVASEL
jgi:hypothetical protein